MNYLIKSLLSRPGDNSWDRELWKFFGIEENSRKYNAPYCNPGIINWRLLFSQQRLIHNGSEINEHLIYKPIRGLIETLKREKFKSVVNDKAEQHHSKSITKENVNYYETTNGLLLFTDYDMLKALFDDLDENMIDGKISFNFIIIQLTVKFNLKRNLRKID